MNRVVKLVKKLEKEVGREVESRIKEFENVRNKFSELFFVF